MHVVDSHTGGEPTRVIIEGGPDLGSGSLAEQAQRLATEHPSFCQSILLEPRGQIAMVGALLVPSNHPECIAGVIYLNADAVLGMCGHGTIGLAVTLAHLGRIGLGTHKIETPVGIVEVDLLDANTVVLTNVESRRVAKNVAVEVEGVGTLVGDVAYGGNWFYLVDPSPIPLLRENLSQLTQLAIAVRQATITQGIGGEEGQLIDHVVFQDSSPKAKCHSRNFVLCPSNTYDRSPCGTGSSARLACLAADGDLAPGDSIMQESVLGSSFDLCYQHGMHGGVIPQITGQAFIMAESQLFFHADDPFRHGIKL